MYVVVPFLHPIFHVVENGHVIARFKACDEAEAHAARLNDAEKARHAARRALFSEDAAVCEAAERTMKETADVLRSAGGARSASVKAAADERFLFLTL